MASDHRVLPPGWPIDSDWTEALSDQLTRPEFIKLQQFIQQERSEHCVFPPEEKVFQALAMTPLNQTRVVILGQDPYHGAGQAQGLSFSVPQQCPIPPSLRNIFSELTSDLGCPRPTSGDLTPWARQGVLLLNTVLTVRASQANSHRKKGWESFTDRIIELVSQRPQPAVFILWGKPAEKKLPLIGSQHHTIISPHPSPLSARRGFFGSRPFSRANDFLKQSGQPAIDWRLREQQSQQIQCQTNPGNPVL